MPYSQEISRQNKGCFLFLADQSYSMVEPLGGTGNRKCDDLVTAINGWLQNMAMRASSSEGTKDWMDIGVIGYRTDKDENPIIGPALGDALAGRNLVSITEIAANSRIESRIQILPDEETGGVIEVPVEVPLWISPMAEGGTPMCHTLYMAHQILEEWIAQHPKSFPPVVINLTDGETTDGGNPIEYAESLKSLATEDGNVLLFNCHLSMTAADSLMFPSNYELLPDDFSRLLFQMSSELPESLVQFANKKEGFSLQPGARGMVYNADMVCLIKFLDMGTRVDKKLR